MKDFFKKNGILLFCLLFFICSAGFTVWFLFLILTGGSAVGQVTHRTQDSKKANITIEYQTDGQNYSVKKQYGRNTGLTVGENVKVFFQDAAFPGHSFCEEFLDPSSFVIRNVNSVGMHPAAESGQRFGAA